MCMEFDSCPEYIMPNGALGRKRERGGGEGEKEKKKEKEERKKKTKTRECKRIRYFVAKM